MSRKRKWSDEDLKTAVKNNISVRGVILELGLNPSGGGNYRTITDRIIELKLDTKHFLGNRWALGKSLPQKRKQVNLNEILVKNSPHKSSSALKKILLRKGLLKYVCAFCGISEWREKRIALHLDHINGEHNDNRIENLRLLCPNCHSQTATYCRSKNNNPITKYTRNLECKKYYCDDCGKIVSRNNVNKCQKCYSKSTEKIVWPSVIKLKKIVEEHSYSYVGRLLGVSDNAVRKRILNH